MAALTLTDWNTFLNARVQQENGNHASALAAFDQLLLTYPDNEHLQISRAFALQSLGQGNQAGATLVGLKYAQLGQSLSGPADSPSAWTSNLNAIIGDIGTGNFAAEASALVAW
ncbi:MAG TPA: hypothetical protein VHI13_09360 [Candidatus Kapabacteria bacterium]|nr:hypothetical protein [Candidatus Kapabacteria bacterium]